MAIIGENSIASMNGATLNVSYPHFAIADPNTTPVYDYVCEANQEIFRFAFYFTYQAGDSVQVGVLDITDTDWENNNIDGAPMVASGYVNRSTGDAFNFLELGSPVAITEGRRYRVQFRAAGGNVRTVRRYGGNNAQIRSNTTAANPLDSVFSQLDTSFDQVYPVYAETRVRQVSYTSTQSGNFNNAATWGGVGVPPANESFTINAGHTVTVPNGYSGSHQGRLLGTNAGSRASLIIDDGATFTLSGDLEPQDWCRVQVNGGGVLDLNGFDIAGTSVVVGSVQLSFKGTAVNRAIIQSSVANTGNIEHSDQTSIRAECDHDYVDFVSLGFVRMGGNPNAEHFRLRNAVFFSCDMPTLGGQHHGDADFIIEGVDFRNDVSTTGRIADIVRTDGNQGVAGTGVKLVNKLTFLPGVANTVRWNLNGIDSQNIVSDRVIHERLTNDRNSDLIDWFLRPVNTSAVSAYNGQLAEMSGCYLYSDSDNPHTISANVDLFDSGVIEATYANGFTDSGDHFIVNSARNQSVTNSLVIEQQSGALVKALGSACTGVYEAIHNTLVGNYNNGYGALARTESGGSFAGTANFYSNLVVDRSANAGSLGFNIDTAGDDQITNIDNNCWFNIENIYQGVTSATKTPGVTVGYGGNDIQVDPGFVDSSRDLAAWAALETGTATAQAAIDHLLKINGYNSTSQTQVDGEQSVVGVSVLSAWVRDGYAPTNTALQGQAHDAGDIGALAVAPPTITPTATDYAWADTITVNSAGLGTITSRTLSDGVTTINLPGDDTTAVLPDFGDNVTRLLLGQCTLTFSDGTNSANANINLVAPDGWNTAVLQSGFDTTETSYLFNYSGTPAIGDEFYSEITIDGLGGWSAPSPGVYQFYGVDETDRVMQAFTLTVYAELVAVNAASSTYSSVAALTQTHSLLSANAQTSSVATVSDVSQTHTHTADNAQSSTASTGGVVGQTHSLTSVNASCSTAASVGALVSGSTHNLSATNAQSTSIALTGSVIQSHELQRVDGRSDTAATSVSVTQNHVLVVSNIALSPVATVGAVSTGQVHNLSVSSAVSTTDTSSGFINQVHTLDTSSGRSDSSANSDVIQQSHLLVGLPGLSSPVATVGNIYNAAFNDLVQERLRLVSRTPKFLISKVS